MRACGPLAAIRRGGYVFREGGDAILIATGSEVGVVMDAAAVLADEVIAARVVSMPSTDVFDAQDAAYRESVLPCSMRARVAVEAGVTAGWRACVGEAGTVAGVMRSGSPRRTRLCTSTSA